MKKGKTVRYILCMLCDIYRASPICIIMEFTSAVFLVLNSMLVRIVLLKVILEQVIAGKLLYSVIIAIIAAVGDFIFSAFENWMVNYYRPCNKIYLHKYFHEKLYRSASEVDLKYYDNPDYYDKYIFTTENIDSTAQKLLQTINNLLVTITEILISGGFIISGLSSLLWIVLVPSSLSAIIMTQNAKLKVEMNKAISKPQKKMEYVKRVFFNKIYAPDVRITNIKDLLTDLHSHGESEFMQRAIPYARKRSIYYFLSGGLFYFQYAVIIIFLSWRALELKDLSVADYSILFSSAIILNNNWRFFGSVISELAEYGMFANYYYEFIRTVVSDKKRESNEEARLFKNLKLKDVSFRYTDNGSNIFSDLSIIIKNKQKIAIVGPNGSGKSTLVNLILSLYSPNEGMIKYNNQSINQFNKKSYRSAYSIVFQESRLYPVTIAENLMFKQESEMNNKEIEDIWHVLSLVGLYKKIRKLPEALHTPVTKEFENSGIVFSVGEQQRLIIARSILQDKSIIIMDEPSSAQDPKAESEINKLFMDLANKKTVILISHRLSTISGVDYIYLLRNGSIEESGTHEELISINGYYAEIYNKQAKLYSII